MWALILESMDWIDVSLGQRVFFLSFENHFDEKGVFLLKTSIWRRDYQGSVFIYVFLEYLKILYIFECFWTSKRKLFFGFFSKNKYSLAILENEFFKRRKNPFFEKLYSSHSRPYHLSTISLKDFHLFKITDSVISLCLKKKKIWLSNFKQVGVF